MLQSRAKLEAVEGRDSVVMITRREQSGRVIRGVRGNIVKRAPLDQVVKAFLI